MYNLSDSDSSSSEGDVLRFTWHTEDDSDLASEVSERVHRMNRKGRSTTGGRKVVDGMCPLDEDEDEEEVKYNERDDSSGEYEI
jgi:hypothetical protein